MEGEPGAEVYSAAASKDQARVVFNQAREFVDASPLLRDWLRPMRNAIVCDHTGGVYRVLSSDAPLQHGLNPSMVVVDELWAHRDPALYYALTIGQLARENRWWCPSALQASIGTRSPGRCTSVAASWPARARTPCARRGSCSAGSPPTSTLP
jgi:hypothetical protein